MMKFLTWGQAQFSFRFVTNIPAGKAKRKESLIQTFYEMSAAHFFDWLMFAESANQKLIATVACFFSMQIFHTWKNCRLADLKNHLYRLIFSTKSKTVSTNHIQLLMRLKEILKVFPVGIEGQKFLKRRRHDVLVLIFWPNALKFKILKFPFSVAFIFSLVEILPDFQYINL